MKLRNGYKVRKATASEFDRWFGQRLHAARDKRRWTLRDVSVNTGLSIGFLCNVENGQQGISLENAHRLAAGLGVSVTQFIKRDFAAARMAATRNASQR